MVMVQKEIEVILARHLASYLAMPIFIVDPQGSLIYYNEPAEVILGRRFEETGEMPIAIWSTVFSPTDDEGAPFAPDALPLAVALNKRQTSSARFWIRGLDGVQRHIEVTAFPLIGQDDRYLGAIALFWGLQP
jgi:PAS domain-containing protein